MFGLKLLEPLVTPDFSLSLDLSLAGLELSVQLIVLFVDLTLEFLLNLELSHLVLLQNALEVLGAASVAKLVLVVSELVSLHLLKLLVQVFAEDDIFLVKLDHLELELLLKLLDDHVLVVSLLVLILVELLVNID